MSCSFEKEVLLLQDNEIPFARRMVVEAHLGVCKSCARLEQTVDAISEGLAAGPEAPLGVIAPALDRLEARRQRPLRKLAFAATLMAAGFLLVFLVPRPEVPGTRPIHEPPRRSSAVDLPPPRAPEGPPLAETVAAMDPGSAQEVEAVATRVWREGAAGTSTLASMLEDGDMVARALAVAERVPSPSLLSSLIALLEEEEHAARVARLLGAIGDAGAVPALREALVGVAAVEAREALVAIGGNEAAAALTGRLHREVSEGLLDAVIRTSPRLGAREAMRLAHTEEVTVRAVIERRRGLLLPELRRLARSEGGSSLLLLGWMRDRESLPLLASLARKRGRADAAVRGLLAMGSREALAAAFVAVRRGGPEKPFDGAAGAEDFLIGVLEEGTHDERRTSLRLLRRCGGEKTVRALGATPPERSLMGEAIQTLSTIGGPESLDVLATFVRERSAHHELITALGSIDRPESVRLLVELLLQRRSEREAADALASMPAGLVVPLLLKEFERAPHKLRSVLARIAGIDLGARREPWQRWWESRA
ncbi:MAG: hypothetical protein ACYSX0_03695 [Planctomycetota bacterium]